MHIGETLFRASQRVNQEVVTVGNGIPFEWVHHPTIQPSLSSAVMSMVP